MRPISYLKYAILIESNSGSPAELARLAHTRNQDLSSPDVRNRMRCYHPRTHSIDLPTSSICDDNDDLLIKRQLYLWYKPTGMTLQTEIESVRSKNEQSILSSSPLPAHSTRMPMLHLFKHTTSWSFQTHTTLQNPYSLIGRLGQDLSAPGASNNMKCHPLWIHRTTLLTSNVCDDNEDLFIERQLHLWYEPIEIILQTEVETVRSKTEQPSPSSSLPQTYGTDTLTSSFIRYA